MRVSHSGYYIFWGVITQFLAETCQYFLAYSALYDKYLLRHYVPAYLNRSNLYD
jgi:hypothetical protein